MIPQAQIVSAEAMPHSVQPSQSHDIKFGIQRSSEGHTCYAYTDVYAPGDSHDAAVYRDLVRVLLSVDSPTSYFPSHGAASPPEVDILVTLGERLLACVYAGHMTQIDDLSLLISAAVQEWSQTVAREANVEQTTMVRMWRAFVAGLNENALIKLSPYYFALKHMASGTPAGLPAKFRIQFDPEETPRVGGMVGDCQRLFGQVMARVAASATLYEFWFDAAARAPHSSEPAKRWNERSVMEHITSSGARSTPAVRQRIDGQGRLSAPDSVRHATSAADAAECGVLMIEEFLDRDLCKHLCRAFVDLEAFRYRNDAIDPYWNNRALWFADIKRNLPEAAQLMRSVQRGAMNRVSDFFRLSAPLFPDMLQLLQWPEGVYMAAHADSVHWNGSQHLTPYRDFAGILYLNDDFDGGEIFLTQHNLLVKPRPGMLLSFTGGFYHEHGVTRVERGNRITMPFFMTFSEEKQDLTLE